MCRAVMSAAIDKSPSVVRGVGRERLEMKVKLFEITRSRHCEGHCAVYKVAKQTLETLVLPVGRLPISS